MTPEPTTEATTEATWTRRPIDAALLRAGAYPLSRDQLYRHARWAEALGPLNWAPELARRARPTGHHQLQEELATLQNVSSAALAAELRRREEAAQLTGLHLAFDNIPDPHLEALTSPPANTALEGLAAAQLAPLYAERVAGSTLRNLAGERDITPYFKLLSTIGTHYRARTRTGNPETVPPARLRRAGRDNTAFWAAAGLEAISSAHTALRVIFRTAGQEPGTPKLIDGQPVSPPELGLQVDTTVTSWKKKDPESAKGKGLLNVLSWVPDPTPEDLALRYGGRNHIETLKTVGFDIPVTSAGGPYQSMTVSEIDDWTGLIKDPKPALLLLLAEISPGGWDASKRGWVRRRGPGTDLSRVPERSGDINLQLIQPQLAQLGRWYTLQGLSELRPGSVASLGRSLPSTLASIRRMNRQRAQAAEGPGVFALVLELQAARAAGRAPALRISDAQTLRWSTLARSLGAELDDYLGEVQRRAEQAANHG